MVLEIRIDTDSCIGSGQCEFLAGGVFEVGDDDKARVVDPTAQGRGEIVAAARACPTAAIEVRADGRLLH